MQFLSYVLACCVFRDCTVKSSRELKKRPCFEFKLVWKMKIDELPNYQCVLTNTCKLRNRILRKPEQIQNYFEFGWLTLRTSIGI